MRRAVKLVCILAFLFLLISGLTTLTFMQGATVVPAVMAMPLSAATTLSGTVVDAKGPVAGATVRVQLTTNATQSDAAGKFQLAGLDGTQTVTVTAWSTGHYVGSTLVQPGTTTPVTITINQHYTTDNYEYNWFSHAGVQGSAACGECHQAYPEWQADAHSQAATNIHFATLYAGTDVQGNRSPPVRYDLKKGTALPPDPTQPYYGPGYKLDNPERSGVCATCHAPVAGKIPNNSGCGWSGCHTSATAERSELVPEGVTPLSLKGHAAEGISCEFCHKIASVQINDKTGLPYEDSPGILSLHLLRPKPGEDLFFGPFDDVVRTDLATPRDAYLPLQTQSAFCAGCHYGVMGGVVASMKVAGGVLVYSSYSEWLKSPYYTDDKRAKSCQDCHMAPTGRDRFAFAEKGGQKRDPQKLSGHQMMGATDQASLQNAVSMTATAQIKGGQLLVDVQIINDKSGHNVPTDSPLRHVLLVVQAKDSKGKPLTLREGATLPAWAGDYAGQPGKAFAKVLRDTWTGEMPTAAIWRPIEVVADTRLAPFAMNRSRYAFTLPTGMLPGTPANVEVRLIYRRAYQQLAEQKGWTDPDVVMEQATLQVK